jgi:hypothetical protein
MNGLMENVLQLDETESSGGSAPRTFSKYLEIVSLSTAHFVFRFGLPADQNW